MSAAPSFERYGGSYLRYTGVDMATAGGMYFAIFDRKASQLLRAPNAPRRTWLFTDPDELAQQIERLEATASTSP